VVLFGRVEAEGLFAGYNVGEMAFNDFQHFAGEIGYQLEGGNILKLAHMNVKATEEHLSSSFARAVDGDDVKGLVQGWELFYTFQFLGDWYFGPSVGYYKEEYQHTQRDSSLSGESVTLGLAVGYREENVFGINWLYCDFSIPFRYSLNPFDTTRLGDTTVTSNKLRNNVWFTIGAIF